MEVLAAILDQAVAEVQRLMDDVRGPVKDPPGAGPPAPDNDQPTTAGSTDG